MLLGIDVGGTFTDAVIIDGTQVVKWAKRRSTKDNLLVSIEEVLRDVTTDIDVQCIERVTLSTTVVTNTIVEGKEDDVDLYIVTGPGMNVDHLFPVVPIFLSGYTDHRGMVVESYKMANLVEAMPKKRAHKAAVSVKFGNRNPLEELRIGNALAEHYSQVSCGSMLSGALNFPRRTVSAYFNSAVASVLEMFKVVVVGALQAMGIEAPLYILKADGGSLPIKLALEKPVETIFTGPAATVLGLYASHRMEKGHIVALDIGGTTTDISLWVDGQPLMMRDGVYIRQYPSAVRSFAVTSIGIGGESVVRYVDGVIQVGPERVGPSMALGGDEPTLGDALIVLGHAHYGSYEQAVAGMKKLNPTMSVEVLAKEVVQVALATIRKGIEDVVDLENKKAIYVVDDIVQERRFVVERILLVGGSAYSLATFIEEALHVPVVVPPSAAVTNAIGAAVAKQTIEITLRVDTKRRLLVVPELGLEERGCSLRRIEEVEAKAHQLLRDAALTAGLGSDEETINVETIGVEDFPVIEGWQSKERIMTVRAQLQVGVTHYVES
ncbi:hydantoinase/oxoprolinase family protein [Veillonella agrestimuris]|uniref:hydantoinase/oxoprolinase family protein n=1 Tax=Veillonella agrestimuris TaxID=2941340 RepID=UPI00203D3CC6|nr:hydantoinase/oxoprolinase family protein [Veillonella agrestimuris]